LIQNADDAGATEITFMIDPRHHSTDHDGLWPPGLAKFQGPALLSWNNAQFTENDWESISKIHQSLKDTDPMKVGRFGLGFISIYHISGKHLLYLQGHTQGLRQLVFTMPETLSFPVSESL